MNDAVIKAELCPDGYQFMDQCRNGHREGGKGLMFRDSFCVKKAEGGKHKSFEFSEWIIIRQVSCSYYLLPSLFRSSFCDI